MGVDSTAAVAILAIPPPVVVRTEFGAACDVRAKCRGLECRTRSASMGAPISSTTKLRARIVRRPSHAGTARHRGLREALEARIVGRRLRACASPTRSCCARSTPPLAVAEGQRGAASVRRARQAHRVRARRRPVPRDPPDDRGAPRWPEPGAKPPGAQHAGAFRVRDGHARAHRSGLEAARVAAPGARRGRARRARSRRHRAAGATLRAFAAR